MPKLFFHGFRGEIDEAEATEEKDRYVVAGGPHAGNYLKVRERYGGKGGFFLHKEHAETAAAGLLETMIARCETDLAQMKERLQELQGGQG
jgi:hypothetical protein